MRNRHITDLVGRCIKFANENGETLEKGSNMFFDWHETQINGSVNIHCYAMQSPYSEGFCRVQVKIRGTLVLNAKGDYPGRPSNVNAEVYRPGKWEERIRRR